MGDEDPVCETMNVRGEGSGLGRAQRSVGGDQRGKNDL
jgi:hypothetical protein